MKSWNLGLFSSLSEVEVIHKSAIVSCLAVLLACASPAHADECRSPCIDYSGSFDITGWRIAPDDTGALNYIVIDPAAELESKLRLGSGLSVRSNATADPVVDPRTGENRVFADVGLHLDILHLQYDVGDISIWGGKIRPVFGRASDVAPGLYGAEVGDGYELSDRIGAGGSYGFEAAGFSNVVQANVFTLDRTLLSGSLFTNRHRSRLADGGAGNTPGISSVTLSLAGCKGAEFESCFDDGELGYQLAARYQSGGHGSAGPEFGLEADFNRLITLTDETSLKFLGEIAWFRNYDGGAGNAIFAAGAAAVTHGELTASLTLAGQDIMAAPGGNSRAYVADAELLYDPDGSSAIPGQDWTFALGYTFVHDGRFASHYVGLKVETSFEGSVPLRP